MEEIKPNTPQNKPSNGNNSKMIGGIIAALLVIVAIVWGVMAKKGGDSNMVRSGNEAITKINPDGSRPQPMSIKELMTTGKTQKCEVQFANDKVSTKGTVYIGGGKMRTDVSITGTDGKMINSHMLNDGHYIYTWMDGQVAAMKISLETMTKMQNQQVPSGQTAPQKPVDEDAKYNYNCSGWNAEDIILTPPSNLKFTDQSEMMMNVQKGKMSGDTNQNNSANSLKAQQCAACEQAGDNRAQCLAALNCN